jgi:hypothetical protein
MLFQYIEMYRVHLKMSQGWSTLISNSKINVQYKG